MTRAECAEFLIDLYADYFEMCKKYFRPIEADYSESGEPGYYCAGRKENR